MFARFYTNTFSPFQIAIDALEQLPGGKWGPIQVVEGARSLYEDDNLHEKFKETIVLWGFVIPVVSATAGSCLSQFHVATHVGWKVDNSVRSNAFGRDIKSYHADSVEEMNGLLQEHRTLLETSPEIVGHTPQTWPNVMNNPSSFMYSQRDLGNEMVSAGISTDEFPRAWATSTAYYEPNQDKIGMVASWPRRLPHIKRMVVIHEVEHDLYHENDSFGFDDTGCESACNEIITYMRTLDLIYQSSKVRHWIDGAPTFEKLQSSSPISIWTMPSGVVPITDFTRYRVSLYLNGTSLTSDQKVRLKNFLLGHVKTEGVKQLVQELFDS